MADELNSKTAKHPLGCYTCGKAFEDVTAQVSKSNFTIGDHMLFGTGVLLVDVVTDIENNRLYCLACGPEALKPDL